ncbi:hypothetical protein ACG7TL_006454 [Trametes sanguinea]
MTNKVAIFYVQSEWLRSSALRKNNGSSFESLNRLETAAQYSLPVLNLCDFILPEKPYEDSLGPLRHKTRVGWEKPKPNDCAAALAYLHQGGILKLVVDDRHLRTGPPTGMKWRARTGNEPISGLLLTIAVVFFLDTLLKPLPPPCLPANMATMSLFLMLLCAPALSFARNTNAPRSPSPLWRRGRSVPPMGFYNPTELGGSMLTIAPNTNGLGEPLNVIVSGHSDATVLVDSEDNGGLRNYFLSVGFGAECLGQHAGDAQTANLGDGKGQVNETSELRWDYGDPSLGTCTETIKGGNHFRYWVQDGSKANSDWLVGNATAQQSLIPTGNITNGTTYSGQTSFGGYTYKTDVIYLSGILSNSSQGVNHNVTVGNANTLPVDGYVAVMTISIVSEPQRTTSPAGAILVQKLLETPTILPTSWTILLSSFLLVAPSLYGCLARHGTVTYRHPAIPGH